MAILVGIDLGTTSISAVAFCLENKRRLATVHQANHTNITAKADQLRGYSEWDADKIVATGLATLKQLVDDPAVSSQKQKIVALGVTGQQHGMVLTDHRGEAISPLINWQDRRSEQLIPGEKFSYRDQALELLGESAFQTHGCSLASGFMVTTLFTLGNQGQIPDHSMACFIMDYFVHKLINSTKSMDADKERIFQTDATCAASAGIWNLEQQCWDKEALRRLNLRESLLPQICPSATIAGHVSTAIAKEIGISIGTPVTIPCGDNQASFLGSVSNWTEGVLVNIGTGGQISVNTNRLNTKVGNKIVERRPFFDNTQLLVCAGLTGGRVLADWERFFHEIGEQLFGQSSGPLFERLLQLGEDTYRGIESGKLSEEPIFLPYFHGTRHQPDRQAEIRNLRGGNLTPGHLTLALIQGMVSSFQEGYEALLATGEVPRNRLYASGNGARSNRLFTKLAAQKFALPLQIPAASEEAAFGAALCSGVACKAIPSFSAVSHLIEYEF